MRIHSNCMGRDDVKALNLGDVQNGNGLRTLTTRETHGESRVDVNIMLDRERITQSGVILFF